MNVAIRQKEGLDTNWGYRKYAQDNAKSIREINFEKAMADVSNVPRAHHRVPPTLSGDLKEAYLKKYFKIG